jgi:hypothetical protein
LDSLSDMTSSVIRDAKISEDDDLLSQRLDHDDVVVEGRITAKDHPVTFCYVVLRCHGGSSPSVVIAHVSVMRLDTPTFAAHHKQDQHRPSSRSR